MAKNLRQVLDSWGNPARSCEPEATEPCCFRWVSCFSLRPSPKGMASNRKLRSPLLAVLAHLYDTSRAGQGITTILRVAIITDFLNQEPGEMV